MPRLPRFSNADRFISRRVPAAHFHKLDGAINHYMRHESGLWKKAASIIGGIFLLGFVTAPTKMIGLLQAYLGPLFK
ncbi:MAG: hypothetical protein HOC91_04480 [Nitrospinaceae bacterium]|nr:hypothetical protein [Nitrospinaceae bacterium]MBT3432700.1 hypothetical protein [Nitrospinaceae bacterium]MBT3822013.1 hypothetical protein [Nitrospinaceae bacterium]MBT4094501.1 hypothetical protein [Nitrospinaceae bacterium]MBT4429750.1 hypothetical protein [Nitrospinaceae bacterium]